MQETGRRTQLERHWEAHNLQLRMGATGPSKARLEMFSSIARLCKSLSRRRGPRGVRNGTRWCLAEFVPSSRSKALTCEWPFLRADQLQSP